METKEPLLDVVNLHVTFKTRRGLVDAVRDVSLRIDRGMVVGVVGESGSGKSVTAYAITHLLETAGRIAGGHIHYRGRDITNATWRTLRGTHAAAIAMIFQNPRAALNPIRSIGAQIVDALRTKAKLDDGQARKQAIALLNDVLIRDPESRYNAYPHQLSGGMCQRVMIAIAIASEPDLLIADEPTTGLDVTTQKAVMDLLSSLVRARGMSMMLITHDLGLAAQYCDEITVMQHGRVVESAPPAHLFDRPREAYTRRLLAASPGPHSKVADLVVGDDGQPPAASVEARGAVSTGGALGRLAPGTPPLLEVNAVSKQFGEFMAVGGVSLRIAPGESVGLVGESGSGKSTLSRMICRLLDASSGDILFDGQSISDTPARFFHKSVLRRDVQLVFQDPHDSLNPRFTAFDCIAHPLRRLDKMRDGAALTARVLDCARRVGLPDDLLERYPHQLSGGQKARVGIARAIACQPRLLVLDEPTAALDVSVQAVILQLLEKLRREEGLSFLFVSHDLNVVRMMCERTIVLRQGVIVEEGESEALFTDPQHDYTKRLLAAIPHMPRLGESNGNTDLATLSTAEHE
jgi:peptide/nickel transport system ATP-binding protein